MKTFSLHAYLLFCTLVVHLALALACWMAPHNPTLHCVVQRTWDWLWLAGPSANLVYGTAYLLPFLCGSIVTASAALLALWSQDRGRQFIFLFFASLSWCASGFLVYAPTT